MDVEAGRPGDAAVAGCLGLTAPVKGALRKTVTYKRCMQVSGFPAVPNRPPALVIAFVLCFRKRMQRRFFSRLVRNPDFIYKQVHNPDVTNPDLADVRVKHLFVSP
jgi:hypothetical protein